MELSLDTNFSSLLVYGFTRLKEDANYPLEDFRIKTRALLRIPCALQCRK
jgi:hypothetical protein